MKFLVTWRVVEAITQEQAKPLRAGFGQAVEQFRSAPQVKDLGIFADVRGGYFVLDVDTADEIMAVLGPESLDNTAIEAHPIVDTDRVLELFGQWAEQGR